MKPLFIWAGGKTKVLKHYAPFFPPCSSFSNYYEPFFGGGAVFVYVMKTYKPQNKIRKFVIVFLEPRLQLQLPVILAGHNRVGDRNH